jgi:NAD(P)-dependent dehydrogenase (short-subunit alcohol dehydrogenase family)
MSTPAALVTGSSSGIGLAIAAALAEEGYALTICARDRGRLAAAVAGLRGAGACVEGVVADVSREEEVIELFSRHRFAHGRLDLLVNNAGVLIVSPLDRLRAEDLDTQLAVNLRAMILTTREALPMLREVAAEGGDALIVNVASRAGTIGHPQAPVYAAAKAAVINFTESTHCDAGPDGVYCTALVPGYVNTTMTDRVRDTVTADDMIQPSDIGEAIRFLLRTSPGCHVPEIPFRARGTFRPSR